jgi:hypothetical protein
MGCLDTDVANGEYLINEQSRIEKKGCLFFLPLKKEGSQIKRYWNINILLKTKL